MNRKKIVIGSTRAGLSLKKALIFHLESKGFQMDDVGMKEGGEFVPYHKAAAAVARNVSEKRYERGIIICGTGAGSVITAAKFKGVYPVHVFNTLTAQQSKAVNNCNVLVFGEWLTPPKHACQLVDEWLETGFTDGVDDDWKIFLTNCVKEIGELENEQFK
ncbi:MAG: RpiB/LacA/LacB family sugar-phosphate isomerase [Bacteroidales bacterium]|jgi:ribose 5-phosphate isomerase B|nr:RpiB/LacA/LacB family sugar-phosphate isomerase [Bacteroidales bacterium]